MLLSKLGKKVIIKIAVMNQYILNSDCKYLLRRYLRNDLFLCEIFGDRRTRVNTLITVPEHFYIWFEEIFLILFH